MENLAALKVRRSVRGTNNKYFFLSLYIIMFIISFPACSYASLISEVVERYCFLDSMGFRLDSEKYIEVRKLMSWDDDQDEPGWDCVKIILGYKVLKETADDKTATVTVEYDIIGDICGTVFNNKRYREFVDFQLINADTTWKIKNYIQYPRITPDIAITTMVDLIKTNYAEEPDAIRKLRSIIKELEELAN